MYGREQIKRLSMVKYDQGRLSKLRQGHILLRIRTAKFCTVHSNTVRSSTFEYGTVRSSTNANGNIRLRTVGVRYGTIRVRYGSGNKKKCCTKFKFLRNVLNINE